jgi:hypothetical protein
MEFVEYVYATTENGVTEEIGRLFTDGLNMFLVPIAWTFSEAFDSTVYAIGDYLGISE